MISVISDVCKRSDYHSNIRLISKNEAMNLKQNAHLTEKSWVFHKEKYQEQCGNHKFTRNFNLKNIKNLKVYIKMEKAL